MPNSGIVASCVLAFISLLLLAFRTVRRHYALMEPSPGIPFPVGLLLGADSGFSSDIAQWGGACIMQINRLRTTCYRHMHSLRIPGVSVLFFTGTCGIGEWLAGAHLYSGNVVNECESYHAGWKRIYDAEPPRGDDDGTWLFGYSLGGALATIHAAELLRRGKRVAGLYTFGSPRVCDGATARMIDRLVPNNYRISNKNDPVVRSPPEFAGYVHTGREIAVSFFDVLCNHTLVNYIKHLPR